MAPIIEHIMDHFHRFGFQRCLLSLNYKAEMIRLYWEIGRAIKDVKIDVILSTIIGTSLKWSVWQ